MKHFISVNDITVQQFNDLLTLTQKLKKEHKEGVAHPHLQGKTLGMIFTKSSTCTRVSFEVGMVQLGGYPLFLNANDIQLGRGETIYDTAMVLSRFIDGIMIRTFKHSDVTDLAKFGSIPIINGLTDDEHPCQAMADLFTVYEYKHRLKGLKMAYVGDGNNVAHSLLHACAKACMDIAVATPDGYECQEKFVNEAKATAQMTGSQVFITNDPIEAVKNADVVYTDTWVSMGQEEEKAKRASIFSAYQVNTELMGYAKADAMFLHCLPAYRGYEVTDEVINGKQSAVFDQAENRMHVQKAILMTVMGTKE